VEVSIKAIEKPLQ